METADNPHQQDVPVLPGAQRRKLYFNPAYFDRQLLLVSKLNFDDRTRRKSRVFSIRASHPREFNVFNVGGMF